MHQQLAATLDAALDRIADIQRRARDGQRTPTRWPMIVLRTPKGWTGPAQIGGLPVEGTWRSHQVPFGDVSGTPARRQALEDWLRSDRPDELFDDDGGPRPDVVGRLRTGSRRMGSNPHTNGGALVRDLTLPDFRAHAQAVDVPGASTSGPTRVLGRRLRDVIAATPPTGTSARSARTRPPPTVSTPSTR